MLLRQSPSRVDEVSALQQELTERAWASHAAGNTVAAQTYWEILHLTNGLLPGTAP